jgi:hypothetical protein
MVTIGTIPTQGALTSLGHAERYRPSETRQNGGEEWERSSGFVG